MPRLGNGAVDSLRAALKFAFAKTAYTPAGAPVAYLSLPEATAAAFAGQPNVRLVGQHTNGLTSTNSFEFVSDGSVLNLTIGYFADRDGVVYRQGIPPDIPVAEDAPGEDPERDAALAYIAEQ